jgi:hypothetical protein
MTGISLLSSGFHDVPPCSGSYNIQRRNPGFCYKSSNNITFTIVTYPTNIGSFDKKIFGPIEISVKQDITSLN